MEAFLNEGRFCTQLAEPSNRSVNVIDPNTVRFYSVDMKRFVEVWNGEKLKIRLLYADAGIIVRTKEVLDLWFSIRKLVDNIYQLTFISMGEYLLIPELFMTPKDRKYLGVKLGCEVFHEIELSPITNAQKVSVHSEWGYKVETAPLKLPDMTAERQLKRLIKVDEDYDSFKMPEIELSDVMREKFNIITRTPDTWFFYTLMTGMKALFMNEVDFARIVGALVNPSGEFFKFCDESKYIFLAEYWMNAMNIKMSIDYLRTKGMTKIALINLARERISNFDQFLKTFIEWKILDLTCYESVAADFRLAQILFFKVCHRYVTIPYIDSRGVQRRQWYEFVDLSSGADTNHLFKWRESTDSVQIKNIIRFELISCYRNVRQKMNEDPEYARFSERSKELTIAIKALESDAVENRLIEVVGEYLINRDFMSKLNTDPDVLGVNNGLLELPNESRDTRLIRGYHHYIINKSAGALWDEDIFLSLGDRLEDIPHLTARKLMRWWNDAHAEPDAAEYRLFYLSQTLSGRPKPGFMFQLVGNGQRGKTTWTVLTRNALGNYADNLNPRLLLNATFQETANNHSTALVRAEGLRYGAMNESPEGGVLNEIALKTLFSLGAKVTGRQIREAEKEMSIDLCLELTTNHELKCFAVDWGTYRRMKIYRCKFIYLSEREPVGQFEKKADPEIKKCLQSPEYHAAWLTILSHYYRRFWTEYKGEWDRVPLSPTIERETWEYRIAQNKIYHFAVEMVVRIKEGVKHESYDRTTMNQMVSAFQRWYIERYRGSSRYNDADRVETELKASILEPYMSEDYENRRIIKVFQGLRVLGLESPYYPKNNYDPEREEPVALSAEGFMNQVTK